MNRRKQEILVGSCLLGAGAFLAGAASVAMVSLFMQVAMSRQIPRSLNTLRKRQRLQGYAMDTSFAELLEKTGKRLKNQPHEIVEITAFDGAKLIGHWFPAKHPKRVLVAMHGWRSSWDRDFGYCRPFYEQNDCSVLYAEQRGQGLSEGEYMGFGLLERYDCRDWANWVAERVGEDLPIYLAGISMGATTVLMAAGLELPKNVRGIQADCGFTSPDAIWKHVARENLRIPYKINGRMANRLCRRRIRQGANAYTTIQAMEHCQVPVFFAHGEEDHFVPVQMTYENYHACAAPKRLLIVPGADHGMSYPTDRSRYEETVLQFWNDCEKDA